MAQIGYTENGNVMEKDPLNILKVIPALVTGVFAVWGTYVYFTSPYWSDATLGDLIADYVSPFVCCIGVLIVCRLIKSQKICISIMGYQRKI